MDEPKSYRKETSEPINEANAKYDSKDQLKDSINGVLTEQIKNYKDWQSAARDFLAEKDNIIMNLNQQITKANQEKDAVRSQLHKHNELYLLTLENKKYIEAQLATHKQILRDIINSFAGRKYAD